MEILIHEGVLEESSASRWIKNAAASDSSEGPAQVVSGLDGTGFHVGHRCARCPRPSSPACYLNHACLCFSRPGATDWDGHRVS